MKHAEHLIEIAQADPVLRRALTEADRFALHDWWIVSGAIYNSVWNAITGRPPGYGIKDIDLFYFDPDTSYEAEDQVIRRGADHFSAHPPVEIRNQARVHLWFERHFGRAIAPIPNCRASILDFASETHAVGLRLTNGEIEICAPYGLEAIFDMRLVPNLRNHNSPTHQAKAARAKKVWPEVSIEAWPGSLTVRKATPDEDWEALLRLLVQAFAYMEGRIDPPSSLNRLDAAALRQMASQHNCLTVTEHDKIVGCAFLQVCEDHLYLSKLAIDASSRGRGLAHLLIRHAAAEARAQKLDAIQLQTRVELTENHAAFARMGFVRTGETAHSGYDRPTSITMRKAL